MADPLNGLIARTGLRLVNLGDLPRLTFDSAHHHLGLPDVSRWHLEATSSTQLRLVNDSLDPSDSYMASVADWLGAFAGSDTGATGNAAKLLDAMRALAKAGKVLGPLTVPALVWDVPQVQEDPPVPKPAHSLITIKGNLGPVSSPVEQWSWTLKTAASAFPAEEDALNDAAETVWNAWVQFFAPVHPNSISLTQVLYAKVDATDHYATNPDGSYQQGQHSAAPVPGAAGANILPLQTAVAVSLRSSRPGPTGRGRFFLPWQGGLGADYCLSQTDVQKVGIATQGLIASVNALGGGPVAVVSSKGYTSDVTNVAVGRVPDTQRSRRENLLEQYQVFPLSV